MGAGGTSFRARLVPPWHSGRARLWWSGAALVVLVVWQYLILAASVGVFYKMHTPGQMLELVLQAAADDFWPGEYGSCTTRWYRLAQLGPCSAAAFWLLCLAPWKRRCIRVGVAIVAAVLPLSFLGVNWLYRPLVVIIGPFEGLWVLVRGGMGKDFENHGYCFGPSVWFWILAAAIALEFASRRPRPGDCSNCGYPLAGLPTTKCPECGIEQNVQSS